MIIYLWLEAGKETVFFSWNYLSGRIDRFLHKSTLYINGLSNTEQFDSTFLDYAYQIVELVTSLEKHKENKYFLTLTCNFLNTPQMDFCEDEIYHNQAQIYTEAF